MQTLTKREVNMTQEEAKKYIKAVQWAAQKSKSNIKEAGQEFVLKDEENPDFQYLQDDNPISLITISEKMLNKAKLEPIDVYNLQILVSKTPAVKLCLEVGYYGYRQEQEFKLKDLLKIAQ